jgi:hypothetical protein
MAKYGDTGSTPTLYEEPRGDAEGDVQMTHIDAGRR